MTMSEIKLVKYRDAGLPTFTYFWVTNDHKVISPYFDSEKEAQDWLEIESYKEQAQGLWSDSCTTQRKS
jgi:hypothetical protein